jgi:hypothetical protein
VNDDRAEQLIEAIDRLRDEVECLSKVVSKGFHILKFEMRKSRADQLMADEHVEE